MEYLAYIYFLVVLVCIVEAVLYTEWDLESKKEFKNREKSINKK